MLYTLVMLGGVVIAAIGLPVAYKLGKSRGRQIELQSRWFGMDSLDSLTPREALALASSAYHERSYGGPEKWSLKLIDAVTKVEFSVEHKSLPDLIAMQVRHYAAQQTIKQLESGS